MEKGVKRCDLLGANANVNLDTRDESNEFLRLLYAYTNVPIRQVSRSSKGPGRGC